MGALVNEQTDTQKSMILRYMQENGGITQLQAVEEFGCYRLSGRIYDLKKDGFAIRKEIMTKKNRYGKAINFAKYTLEDNT